MDKDLAGGRFYGKIVGRRIELLMGRVYQEIGDVGADAGVHATGILGPVNTAVGADPYPGVLRPRVKDVADPARCGGIDGQVEMKSPVKMPNELQVWAPSVLL